VLSAFPAICGWCWLSPRYLSSLITFGGLKFSSEFRRVSFSLCTCEINFQLKMDPSDRPQKKRFVSLASAGLKLTKVPQNLVHVPARAPSATAAAPRPQPQPSMNKMPPQSSSDFRKQALDRMFAGLTSEQQAVAKRVKDENLFLSGPAGTGKSTLFKWLVLEAKYRHKTGVAVTGSTGVAAVSVGGSTVHQWGGIGRGEGLKEEVLARIQGNKTAVANWLK